MQARVQKWGNSLAVRIPSAFAQELEFEEGTEVDVRLDGESLRVARAAPRLTLEALLADLPEDVTFDEWDTGDAELRQSRG
jgi:antitoxin MazE